MYHDFSFIIIYIAAFGLDSIFVDHFKFNKKTKIIYYTLLLIIGVTLAIT